MIFFFCECKYSNVISYIEDRTPYLCATYIPTAGLKLHAPETKLFSWFKIGI